MKIAFYYSRLFRSDDKESQYLHVQSVCMPETRRCQGADPLARHAPDTFTSNRLSTRACRYRSVPSCSQRQAATAKEGVGHNRIVCAPFSRGVSDIPSLSLHLPSKGDERLFGRIVPLLQLVVAMVPHGPPGRNLPH